MFSAQGKLDKIACPAHKAGTCEAARVRCPFGHSITGETTGASSSSSSSQQLQSAARSGSSSGPSSPDKKPVSLLESITSRAKQPAAIQRQTSPTSASPPSKRSLPDSQAQSSATAAEMPMNKKSRNAYDRRGSGSTQNGTQQQQSKQAAAMQMPTIEGHPQASKVPLSARQGSLRAIFAAYVKLYEPLIQCPDRDVSAAGSKLARDDAQAQEADLFHASNEHSYKNSVRSALVGIGGRESTRIQDAVRQTLLEKNKQLSELGMPVFTRHYIDTCTETGTQLQVAKKRMELASKSKGKLTLARMKEKLFLSPVSALEMWGYIVAVPTANGAAAEAEQTKQELEAADETAVKLCNRCGEEFLVVPLDSIGEDDAPQCRFHFGRRRPTDLKDPATRKKLLAWTCCGQTIRAEVYQDHDQDQQTRCASAPVHVFKEETPLALHRREPFVLAAELLRERAEDQVNGGASSSSSSDAQADGLQKLPKHKHDVLALDCELIYTAEGMSLAQLCVVDAEGRVLFDVLVKPSAPVLDYNTRFSGVSAASYGAEGDARGKKEVLTLQQARQRLLALMHEQTVLVGGGLRRSANR